MTELGTSEEMPFGVNVTGPLARRYAKAFLDSVPDDAERESNIQKISELAGLISGDTRSDAFFKDKRLSVEDALCSIHALCDSLNLGGALRRFLGVVTVNRRLDKLSSILAAVIELDRAERGEMMVEVQSAAPLSEAQRADLRARVSDMGHKSFIISESVNPALIGGLVVKIGPKLFDSSISGRLTRLQFAMKGAA